VLGPASTDVNRNHPVLAGTIGVIKLKDGEMGIAARQGALRAPVSIFMRRRFQHTLYGSLAGA
jgi:hypothetical protein